MSVELERMFSPEMLRALDERIRRIVLESHLPPVQSEEFLSLNSAAARFDIPIVTLRKWVHSGRVKKYKFGRCVRIRPSDLLRENENDG